MSIDPLPVGGTVVAIRALREQCGACTILLAQALGEWVLSHTITLIPGDGTGPEIVEATRRAIEATGAKIEWDIHEIGMPAMTKHGTPFPKEALESVRRNRIALKGPLTTELGTGFRSANVALRKESTCTQPATS